MTTELIRAFSHIFLTDIWTNFPNNVFDSKIYDNIIVHLLAWLFWTFYLSHSNVINVLRLLEHLFLETTVEGYIATY